MAGRSTGRPEERHHPAIGQARHPAVSPKDQRTTSAYIYGAICPAEGKGAGLVLPRCNTKGMTLHLAEISATVAPGAHALLLLDRAGWHSSQTLVVPSNITLLPLPPKCPELNPVENVRRFMRDNWLSNCVFKSYGEILDQCCFAWNRLTHQPWRIMSLGLRTRAHRFFRESWYEVFGASPPASMLIPVTLLFADDVSFEIDAVAVLPGTGCPRVTRR